MSDMNASQFNEIWLTAMDALIQNRLAGLDYDKTIKAKIIKDKGNGLYMVEQDGVIKFDAQAINNATYSINDEVYILVPQGDFSSSKVIVSKSKLNDNNSIVNYVSPLDTIVSSDNLATNITATYGIQANGNDIGNEPLAILNLEELGLKHNFMYNTLGLNVSFKTLFSKIDMLTGNYGILLRLAMEDGAVYSAIFDSSEMFGNPYNYMTFFQQSKLFDLSKYETSITHISIYLYQQSNFTHQVGENIIPLEAKFINGVKGLEPVNNILMSNLQIVLGDNLISIPDNTFSLVVDDEKDSSTTYYDGETKIIRATWYNKTEDNEFIGFSDGVVDTEYDEEEYQNEFETEWSGAQSAEIENVAPLQQSLQIYYDTEKIHSILGEMRRYADQDIYTLVTALNNYLIKFNQTDYTNEDIATSIVNYQTAFIKALGEEQDVDSWQTLYQKYLSDINHNYLILIEESEEELKSNIAFDARLNSEYEYIIACWSLIKNQFEAWMTQLKTITDGEDMNGDIRAYADRQNRIFIQCKNSIDKLQHQLETLVNANTKHAEDLAKRMDNSDTENFDLTAFEQEYQNFVKLNENKYCIYWYRVNPAAAGDMWSNSGWDRMDWGVSSAPGMPDVNETGLAYKEKSSSKAYITLKGDDRKEEKIKAILIFNHIPYESNILTFENINPPSDDSISQPEDTITILHGKNSQDSFQKYSSIFTLINASDARLNRALQLQYNSVDENISSLDALKDTVVYWYIPTQATMLDYNADYLNSAGFTKLSTMLTALVGDDLAYYTSLVLPGYECFFKEIKSEKDITFYYRIQNLYQQSANMNSIYCRLEKGNRILNASIPFTFSTYGTNGTQYTLSIVPAGHQNAIEYYSGTTKPLYIEISFTGYEGAKIENPPGVDISHLLGSDSSNWTPNCDLVNDEELAAVGIQKRDGSIYYKLSRAVDFSKCLFNTIVARSYWGQIDNITEANELLALKSYYPVAQTSGPYYLDGPTTVIYDSLGTNPNYIHKPYKLFYTNNNALVENLTWEIRHYDHEGSRITDLTNVGRYLPSLKNQEEVTPSYPEIGWYLRPLSMFVQSLNIYSVVVALQNGSPIYAQPIYIAQNRWESSMLNSWNEDLTIDEEKGIILSTMMGAGYKDDANSFNGVLIGDVGSTAGIQNVGLYGFNSGAQSFGFDINGKAFIGKEGRGRIEFNGNDGTISSSSEIRSQTGAGMVIDIDDGIIEMLGPRDNNKQAKIYMSIDGSSSKPYFMLKSKNGTTLMEVSENNYYLQTETFDASNYTGVKLDLKNNKITAGDFIIKTNNGTNFITIDSTATTYPLSIGTSVDGANFKVKWDGTLMATNGKFTGDITGGTIAIGNKFSVDNNGNVIAKKITVNSSLSDPSSIAGWTVDNNSIRTGELGKASSMWLCRNGTSSEASIGDSGSISGWCIAIGDKFGVDNGGNLWAKDANLSGSIKATSGFIGKLKIDSSGLAATGQYTLDSSGLILAKSTAVVQVGDLKIGYASGRTTISTAGPLVLAGSNGTQIGLMTNNGSRTVSGDVHLYFCESDPAGTDKRAASVYLTITGSAPLYPLRVPCDYESYATNGQVCQWGGFNLEFKAGATSTSTHTFDLADGIYYQGGTRFKGPNGSWTAKSESKSYVDLGVIMRYTQTEASTEISMTGNIIPSASDTYNLGKDSRRWNAVFAQTGTIQTSDRNEKFNIQPLNDQYIAIFDDLKPVSYQFKTNSSNRTHVGLIAQDIKNTLTTVGLTTNEFAGYCEWQNEDGTSGSGLRYDEFIALCIKQIQLLKARVAILEDEKKERIDYDFNK